MLILPRRARWSFRVLRSLSSSVSIPIVASSTSSLGFDSCFEPNTSDQVYSNNRRIGHFIKSGDLNNALKVFDEMPQYDVVTYNLLISGHGRFGHREQAFRLSTDMVSRGIRESASTFSSVLGTCTDAGLYREGVQVHCRAVSLGFSLNMYVGSSLVDLYLRMGQENVAVKLFDELQERNLAVWNLLLRGFCELGRVDELFGMYYRMKLDGVDPNGLSYCYWIRACSNGKLLDEGKQLHCGVVKEGWLESNVFVANALVDLYSACGSLIDTREAFEAIPVEDVISWNSIIWVYTENGLLLDALELFTRMQFWGKRPSIRSFVGYTYVVKSGFDHDASFHIQSALIDMYGKCSDIESSVFIYENGRDRNLECCNSLMTSLLHCGVIEDVVEMFGLMVDEGIGLDEVTLSTTLKALSVSAFASLGSCKLLHCCAVKSGFESDIAVSCSLIEAYARCGHVKLSCQVFDELPLPNVICFTSIIHGYARNGMGGECLHLLQEMVAKGLKPDKVTVLCVLSGCNHSGLVEEAKLLFDSMEMLYEAGQVCYMKLKSCCNTHPEKVTVMWSSLLRSCRVHKNEIVGRRTVKSLLELEGKDPAILLQASNFYSEIGEFDTAMQIREFAIAQQVTRDIGHSLVEVNSRSHR
ncbi:putative tetratricopeptide-like helical domain-containing protein [Rosa chinensis]|uniref:Putative tetratricopeptide-like helical domain-containing protein n=1 Tax=Rosa chinensis TaxID=74649 RepID=A0A2P6QT86_ROSCH|nr:putative tetratricopeptide-like helical domain-containing protein [Rosa chinensis]